MPFPAMLREDYWESYEFQDDDLNFIYNHLLEIETPQTPQELLRAIVEQRIRKEKKALASKRQAGGILYIPKESYAVGQKLIFPAIQWQLGEVVGSRQAVNPDLPPFKVLDVAMDAGDKRSFASELELHNLNQSPIEETNDPGLNPEVVLHQHGQELMSRMTAALEANPELVRIAGRWFPRSLVVDINIGHMNLAEALLDMEAGRPVPTSSILEQVELLTDVNHKLTEFSLNLALQEDGRFDEVGPAGEVMWYLRRLEPEAVKNIPVYLRYHPAPPESETVGEPENLLPAYVIDELDNSVTDAAPNEAIVSLIFPHWRAGTLPLAGSLSNLFPTAHESPRIRFTFIAPDSGESFPGWVVRQSKYVYGLSGWYAEQGLMPGSLIYLRRSKNQGEIIISTEKRRSTRDWVRTALVGTDGGIVFAMLKQLVTSNYDERMAIAIPDPKAFDNLWQSGSRQKSPVDRTILAMMRELTKINLQEHVHALELYAAVNLVRRCPPSLILNTLVSRPWATHFGDLYYRLDASRLENNSHD